MYVHVYTQLKVKLSQSTSMDLLPLLKKSKARTICYDFYHSYIDVALFFKI